jgi:hypothetical protein
LKKPQRPFTIRFEALGHEKNLGTDMLEEMTQLDLRLPIAGELGSRIKVPDAAAKRRLIEMHGFSRVEAKTGVGGPESQDGKLDAGFPKPAHRKRRRALCGNAKHVRCLPYGSCTNYKGTGDVRRLGMSPDEVAELAGAPNRSIRAFRSQR